MSGLRVTELLYQYPSAQQQALKGIDLNICPGEFHALLGPNGAGKSTLLSLITGLRKIQIGQVWVGGVDLTRDRLQALTRLGVVFQQPTLDLDLTVEQNLNYFAALNGLVSKHAKLRVNEELERFELTGKRREKVRRLNGGHRRRAEIARALLHQPSLLLFDEATVGLDVPTRQRLVDHIHNLCADHQIAVLWATHLVDEIRPTDTVTLLNQGASVGYGQCDEMLKENQVENLKQLFNQLVQPEYDAREVSL